MWVPASVVYVGVGLALLARWIVCSDGQIGYNACRNATDNRRDT